MTQAKSTTIRIILQNYLPMARGDTLDEIALEILTALQNAGARPPEDPSQRITERQAMPASH